MSHQAKRKVWFDRNDRAEALEAEGREDEALALYEANAAEGCDIAFTYERLAVLYRRRERFDDEVLALERALGIERQRGPTSQVVRLEKRIETAHQVRERAIRIPRELRDRDVTEPVMVDRGGPARKKKGCLFVLALFAAAGLLLAAV